MCSFATTAYTEKLHSKHFWTLKMSLSFDLKSLIFSLSPAPARLHCMDSTQYAIVTSIILFFLSLQKRQRYTVGVWKQSERGDTKTKGAGTVD